MGYKTRNTFVVLVVLGGLFLTGAATYYNATHEHNEYGWWMVLPTMELLAGTIITGSYILLARNERLLRWLKIPAGLTVAMAALLIVVCILRFFAVLNHGWVLLYYISNIAIALLGYIIVALLYDVSHNAKDEYP